MARRSLFPTKMLSTLFYISTILSLCLGSPNGAPSCQINEKRIGSAMRPASDLGYSLFVAPAGNNNWNITIKNKSNRPTLSGLLLYVHQANCEKDNIHLGSITFQDKAKWKYQPSDLCKSGNVTQSTPQSTVTHAHPSLVQLDTLTFVWTSNSKELALNALVVDAVVSTIDSTLPGPSPWQRLQYFGIPPTLSN